MAKPDLHGVCGQWPLAFPTTIIHVPSLCSAAAFLGLFLLTIANLLMRTRLPSRKHRKTTFTPNIRRIVTDVPFLICAVGSVSLHWYDALYTLTSMTLQRVLCLLGLVLPMYGFIRLSCYYCALTSCEVFYLQLFANVHGVSPHLARYTVRVALRTASHQACLFLISRSLSSTAHRYLDEPSRTSSRTSGDRSMVRIPQREPVKTRPRSC